MSVPFLIIDGYNLLHAAGLARVRYARGDLERVRQRLLALLCDRLTPAEQGRCTVVFDAFHAPLHLHRESRYFGLTVRFAPVNQDADSEIEELIRTHPAAKRLLVVSSDHRLQQAARKKGATPLDSEVFLEELEHRVRRPADPTPSPPREVPPTSAASTDAWLKEFGPVSVEGLEAEVVAEDPSVRNIDAWTKYLAELERTLADRSGLERWLNEDPRRPSP